VALNEIARRIEANRSMITNGKAAFASAVSDLSTLEAVYLQTIIDLNRQAEQNSSDMALVSANAEAVLLVAEFQELKTKAISLQAAVDSIQ